ncbi:hypothetical protein JANAI62_06060 [Jannaschia pagri]|uniref:Outer membrane lipoprotein Blc n=1 Tax=Jannaschia pagri TaxID=2829797 RepID=A0ABQ4NHT4_9RHOB|nr:MULTISPECIES: Hint domain-containing protein [unclassified Jannaschia]GIT89910.1 hypothetical protein JANAI61_03680 [Jannaschia sp. AI_61]GIT93983.1 hypothetical protein JANAI62_06060 [Jannaschia sp. AI_62]
MRSLLVLLALMGCSTAVVAPLLPSYRDQTVTIASKADFDPARYAGRWYEVARFPVPFQEGCASAVAEYSVPEGGTLRLRNICLDGEGAALRQITGTAQVNGPGRLEVRLTGVPLVAPYWVLWTDTGYRTAVVGQPDGRAGWILNRDPVIPADRLRAALTVLQFNGYDTEQLVFSAAQQISYEKSKAIRESVFDLRIGWLLSLSQRSGSGRKYQKKPARIGVGMLGTCAQAQVISTHQIRVDGQGPSARDPFSGATTFQWFGTPLRLDGAREALLLQDVQSQVSLRAKVHAVVDKLSRSRGDLPLGLRPVEAEDAPDALIVTDGTREWQAHLIPVSATEMLLLFEDDVPPSNTALLIVQAGRRPDPLPDRNTICFTPGTRILTEDGPRPVEALAPGDRVLTRDDGPQPILWIGHRHISGARLFAMPHLRPIRIRCGALGVEEPEPDLIVSPGHHVMLTGSKAKALWGQPEVLVRARDLVDDRRVLVAHGLGDVTYIHLMFARHQILWANRVEVESFHPADADLSHMSRPDIEEMLHHAPGVDQDPSAYGAHARRCLSRAELAILNHQGAPAYFT